MSWEKIAEEVGGAFVPLSNLPSEFKGKLINMETREDRRGNPALFLTIQLDEGEQVVQKFTKMFVAELINAFKKLKIKSPKEAVGKVYRWRQTTFSRGNPRWIPVEVIE